jgi:hypothetical protein
MFNSAWKIGMLAKKGSAVDVTPNAVNWDNPVGVGGALTTVNQTITGISSSITLIIADDGNDGYNVDYSINNGSWVRLSFSSQTILGIFYPHSQTFSINNNDTLKFRIDGFGYFEDSGATIRVRNLSDNYVVLDTITFTYG